jgi:hypothetical protein
MANIQSQILMQARNFYSWDIKTISQQKIISPRQRLVGEASSFVTVNEVVLFIKYQYFLNRRNLLW